MPVQHWDALLIPIVLQKLDEITINEWELKQATNNLPSLKELVEFLTKKSFVMESRNYDHSSTQNNLKYRQTQNKKPSSSFHTNSRPETRQVSYSLTGNAFKCQVCGESHFIYQCRTFQSYNISQRYDHIKKYNLCSNCLRTGHDRGNCRSTGCKVCNLKHNTLLHRDNRNNSENSINSSKVTTSITEHDMVGSESSPNCSDIVSNSQSNVLLERNVSNMQNVHLNQSKNSVTNSATVTSRNFIEGIRNCNVLDCVELVDSNNTVSASSSSKNNCINRQVLLSTATIFIQDDQGNYQQCTALLDNGSQSNLITKSLCDKLNLKLNREIINLSSVNKIVTDIFYTTVAIIKSRHDNYSRKLKFSVLPSLTEKLPLIGFDKSQISYPDNLYLADENFNVPKVIDIILGIEVFYEVIGKNQINLGHNLPVLHDTRLGWVFGGNLHFFDTRLNKDKTQICNLITDISNQQLQDLLTRFWEQELPITKHFSRKEKECETHF